MSYRKICVFGPPCVGKTTLSYTALENKIPAFTTHNYWATSSIYNSRSMKEYVTHIINLDIPLFLDCGGLSIGWLNGMKEDGVFTRDTKTVLLLPPIDVYLERERMDIESIGEHRNQDGSKHYDEGFKKKSDYDLVVEEVLSPQEILDYIIEKTGFKNEL